MTLSGHCSDDLALRDIDNFYGPCIRHIHECAAAAGIDLETFRVSLEPDIRDLLPALRVDDGKRTLAVSNNYPVARSIDSNVIGVLAQIDAPFARQVSRPQQPHRAVATIRDVDNIGRW